MDKLFEKLLHLYLTELMNLNVGYTYNSNNISLILELIHVIDYIQNAEPTTNEILKILAYYE